jgi:hypothetical protein
MRIITFLPGLLGLSATALLFAADLAEPKPTPPTAGTAPAVPSPSVVEVLPAPIQGMVLTRPAGDFLGVELDGIALKVTFYDAKKKKTPADAVRIAARWASKVRSDTVLLPISPETLISPAVLRPPQNYIVTIVLIGANDQVLDQHRVNLNELRALTKGSAAAEKEPSMGTDEEATGY